MATNLKQWDNVPANGLKCNVVQENVSRMVLVKSDKNQRQKRLFFSSGHISGVFKNLTTHKKSATFSIFSLSCISKGEFSNKHENRTDNKFHPFLFGLDTKETSWCLCVHNSWQKVARVFVLDTINNGHFVAQAFCATRDDRWYILHYWRLLSNKAHPVLQTLIPHPKMSQSTRQEHRMSSDAEVIVCFTSYEESER